MKQQTRILIGLSVIFLILTSLSAAIYFNSQGLSCDSCNIEFKNIEIFGMKLDQPYIISVDATDLYNNFSNDSCLIEWTRTGGYRYNGN